MIGAWGADLREGDGVPLGGGVKREWSPVQGARGLWAEPGQKAAGIKDPAPQQGP